MLLHLPSSSFLTDPPLTNTVYSLTFLSHHHPPSSCLTSIRQQLSSHHHPLSNNLPSSFLQQRVVRGSGNNSGNNSGRGLDESGIYYDDGQVGGGDVVHDSEGSNHEFNDDIHYRRASAPTVIHYSDFDDEDVVIVGNNIGGANGEVGNPLWANDHDNAP